MEVYLSVSLISWRFQKQIAHLGGIAKEKFRLPETFSSSGFQNFEGIVNWAFLLLAMGGIRLFLENINKWKSEQKWNNWSESWDNILKDPIH